MKQQTGVEAGPMLRLVGCDARPAGRVWQGRAHPQPSESAFDLFRRMRSRYVGHVLFVKEGPNVFEFSDGPSGAGEVADTFDAKHLEQRIAEHIAAGDAVGVVEWKFVGASLARLGIPDGDGRGAALRCVAFRNIVPAAQAKSPAAKRMA